MQLAHDRNIRYSKCSSDSERPHLLLHNLQEFGTPYLRALLLGHSDWYLCVENFAKSLGIGPLAPCIFAASLNEKKINCCK